MSNIVRVKYVHLGQTGKGKLFKCELSSSNLFRSGTEKNIDATIDSQPEINLPMERLVFTGAFDPF